MAQHYSPRLVTDNLVMCLDPSQNKSYPTTDLPVKGGLVMWLDAADDSTFSYSSGTTVSQWRDKSGFNYHGTPLTAGPTRSSSLNSRKVLTFTTSQSIGNLSFTMETSANTVFVVSRLTGTTNSRVLTAYYNNWLLGHWGGLVNPYYAEGWVYYPPNAADTTWRMYMGDWGGPSNDLAAAYSNGTVLTSGSTVASAGPKGLGINFQGGEPSTCEAAEIIVFNRLLTIPERRLIHTYLGQKWGILNTDRSIIDLSGFNDNGLLGNGSTSNMPLFDYYNKGAFKFYASNKYIKLGTSTTINQFSGDFTISLWAMATAENSNYGNLIGDYYTAGVATTNEWQIMMNNSSALLNVYRVGTGYVVSNVSSGVSANTWVNVVLTRVASAITLYANNTVIATATNSLVFGSATGSMTIGVDANNSAEPFSGLISNVLIYNKGLSSAEVAQNYQAQKSRFDNTIVQQGLVLNLDAGNPYSYGGGGTTWYDVSGNNYNGTLTNGPVYDNVNSGRFLFDGTNDNVQLGTASTFLPTSAITINTWVKTNVVGVYKKIFVTVTSGTASVTGIYFSLGPSSDNVYLGIITNNGNKYATSSTTISTTSFVNLCGTYDGSNIRLYLNGTLIATQAQTGTITNSGIGRLSGYDSNTEIWDGYISAFSLYNRALSAAEVLQNYNALKGRFGL
jgi:hypothetical protein